MNCDINTRNINTCNMNTCNMNTCNITCNACCNGLSIKKFDPCKAETILAYVDRIYDGQVGHGSALVETITTDTLAYTTTAQFTPCTSTVCGPSTCTIGVGAIFTIDCVESKLESVSFDTIPVGNVFVNGTIAASVTLANRYIVTVNSNNNIPADDCECKGLGTKSNIVVNNVTGWKYVAKHVLTGNVSFQGQTCKFCITIENSPIGGGHAILPTTLPSTLLIPQICIPDVKSLIYLDFTGHITLLNPTLTVVAIDPTNPAAGNIIRLTSSTILTPDVIAEVIQKTRVGISVIL